MTSPIKSFPTPHLIEILLIEDDDDDVFLMQRTLETDRILNRIHRVQDGVEGMQFLRREGKFAEAVRPDLILLDLNFPRMDGRQVLRKIKENPDLKLIPVVVLTTSDDERDVIESYGHQANSYVTKPVDLIQFRDVLQTIKDYWFSVVKLPPT